VFAKSTGGTILNGFVKGYVPTLSRIYSNVVGKQDWDRIMRLTTNAPMETKRGEKGDWSAAGSYTPEFLLLPALMEWMKKNITTKNVVIVNLTDGSVQHNFITKAQLDGVEDTDNVRYSHWHSNAEDKDTKSLRIKYLRGVPHMTLFIGASRWQCDDLDDMYGDCIHADDGDEFTGAFFKMLFRLVSDYV